MFIREAWKAGSTPPFDKTLVSDMRNIRKFRLYVNYIFPQDVVSMCDDGEQRYRKRGPRTVIVAWDVDFVICRDSKGIFEHFSKRPVSHAPCSWFVMTGCNHPRNSWDRWRIEHRAEDKETWMRAFSSSSFENTGSIVIKALLSYPSNGRISLYSLSFPVTNSHLISFCYHGNLPDPAGDLRHLL